VRHPRSRSRFARTLTVLTLFCALSAKPAWCWGDAAHRLTASIAERLLTPQAREGLARILADEAGYGVPGCPVKDLQDASVWADCVRPQAAYAYTAHWHFDDIPICGHTPREAWCVDGDCLSAQTERLLGVLADPAALRRERLEALKFVVHFLGDLHQPLHAANNADRGGNDVPTSFFGSTDNDRRQNLHRVWDTRLPERLLAGQSDPAGALLARLAPADADAWRLGGIRDWVGESHAIALAVAYGALPRLRTCNERGGEREVLDEAYYERAAPVAAGQLLKAGVRLADVLNRALR